jgi:hypothetical protein
VRAWLFFVFIRVIDNCCAGLANASNTTKEEEEKDKKLAAGKALACAQAVIEHLGW